MAVFWGDDSADKKLSTKTIIFVFESIVHGQLISSSNLGIPGYALGYITLDFSTTLGAIMKVANVNLSVDGESIKVSAFVLTPTLGWSQVSLQPVKYIMFPLDGVIDVVLTATPPSSIAATSTMMFPIEAFIPNRPEIRGVRIRYLNDVLITLLTAVKTIADIGSDSVVIEAGSFDGDQLLLNVRYPGGCGTHSFQLSWDGSFMKSMPPQIAVKLSHNAHGDPCKSIQSELLRFDLSPILGEHHTEISYVHAFSGQNQIAVPLKI